MTYDIKQPPYPLVSLLRVPATLTPFFGKIRRRLRKHPHSSLFSRAFAGDSPVHSALLASLFVVDTP